MLVCVLGDDKLWTIRLWFLWDFSLFTTALFVIILPLSRFFCQHISTTASNIPPPSLLCCLKCLRATVFLFERYQGASVCLQDHTLATPLGAWVHSSSSAGSCLLHWQVSTIFSTMLSSFATLFQTSPFIPWLLHNYIPRILSFGCSMTASDSRTMDASPLCPPN